jgi:hypothetical protein
MKTAVAKQTQDLTYKASTTPGADLAKVAYEGQPKQYRLYKAGYEHYMNNMLVLDPEDTFLSEKVQMNTSVIKRLGDELTRAHWIDTENLPKDHDFVRTILAMEKPMLKEDGTYKEGIELVLAKWGNGFTSPIHGHAAGFMHEELLFGKMKVNLYRMHNEAAGIARPLRTDIYKGNELLVSKYSPFNPMHRFKREHIIHSFTSIGFSASLHYVPEHTRDGRDNQFSVEYFEDFFPFAATTAKRIDSQEAYRLPKGEVVMVRSENVKEYGDHYIIITGHPIRKEHGVRPQDVAIAAKEKLFFGDEKMQNGLLLMQLSPAMREAFYDFHGIQFDGKEVTFPSLD